MGGSVVDPGIVPQETANTLAITEAADLLFQYLRLAQSNNLIDAFVLDPGKNPGNSLQSALVENAKDRKRVRDLILNLTTENVPTTAQMKSASAEISVINPNISVVELGPDAYTFTLIDGDTARSFSLNTTRDAQGQKNADSKTTKVIHYAVVGSNEDFNFSDRAADYVSIFSSLMPSVELSLCVPHFRIDFIQNSLNPSKGAYLPFLSLESFLGAGVEGENNVTSYGLTAMPKAVDSSPIVPLSQGNRASGMELFLAPQTLINADINTTAQYQAARGIEVLDPMQPLMSIESISIDVSAISKSLMTTSSTITLSLVLHDRSRLAEIAPLVTPSLNPSTRALIEFGWNHPDGNPFTSNVYAKFLNALKTKQLYGITQASVSNRDATSLSVRLNLISVGNSTTSTVSVYTGAYVEYELFRTKMDQLLRSINAAGSSDQSYISQEMLVTTSNWENTDKWIKFDEYSKLVNAINEGNIFAPEVDALLKNYSKILSGRTSPANYDTLKTQIPDELRSNLTKELSRFSYTYTRYKDVAGGASAFEYLNKTALNYILDSDGATGSTSTGSSSTKIAAGTISLGDALFRMFTVPMSMSKLFDEVRVMTFDFNDHAGCMGGFNIGLLPIKTSLITSKLKSKTSCMQALNVLMSPARDSSYAAYGIKTTTTQKSTVQGSSDEAGMSGITNPTGDEQRAAFTRNLQALYSGKSSLDKFKNISYEAKFTPPDIKIEMQVVPTVENGQVKQVLCLFIYDGANTGKRSSNILVSALKQSTATTTVYNAASDVQDLTDEQLSKVFNVEKDTVNNTYNITISRTQAKNILSAAYPTIKIGSEGSVITNASYTTSVSGDVENAKKLEATIAASAGASESTAYPSVNADLFIMPASVSITMLGMPLLNRGQNFYIDFGTGTTIDNVYTVTTVKHSIKAGQFTTSATLLPTGGGSIKSIYNEFNKNLGIISKFASSNTPTTTGQITS